MKSIDTEKAIECLGDPEALRSTASCFLREIDAMMELLASAVASGDATVIQEKAHWIKGGLVYLHATPSSEAAKKLETVATLGGAEVAFAYESLCREVAALKEALRELDSESLR